MRAEWCRDTLKFYITITCIVGSMLMTVESVIRKMTATAEFIIVKRRFRDMETEIFINIFMYLAYDDWFLTVIT